MGKYFVIENRNVGAEFVEQILFSGTKEECYIFEDAQRKAYGDNRELVDCFVKSETEMNKLILVNEFWNTLTDEEKKETIIVNGKKYNKALYDFYNRKR